MSRFLIVFIITSVLAIGSIFVWSRNNAESSKVPDTTQSIINFNMPSTTQKPPQATAQQQQQQQQVTHLIIEDVLVGTGSAVKSGDQIEVNYLGTLLNGQKFDSSYDRGETFSFAVGTGQVITGWDQGLLGMKVGGKRRLIIPADLAYGDQGIASIPPNSPLIFEIELISIK